MADEERRTPLHWAAGMDHAQVAALLIKEGAALEAADSKGNTPLMYAGARGMCGNGVGDVVCLGGGEGVGGAGARRRRPDSRLSQQHSAKVLRLRRTGMNCCASVFAGRSDLASGRSAHPVASCRLWHSGSHASPKTQGGREATATPGSAATPPCTDRF